MAVKVDPFLIPIPQAFFKDPELRGWAEYLSRVIHDLRQRTGGESDSISDTSIRESYPFGIHVGEYERGAEINGLFVGGQSTGAELSGLFTTNERPDQFRAVSVNAGSYTALPNDFINAKGRASIKFPAQPPENCVIIIRNGDASLISLDGNGKTINGSNSGYLRKQGSAIHFHYFIDSDEWFAR